jgi:hypothetical protein
VMHIFLESLTRELVFLKLLRSSSSRQTSTSSSLSH